MIVKYIRERGYEGEGKDPHFLLGKTYYVLGINFNHIGKPIDVSIQCDSDHTPVLLDLKFLDVINPAIPHDWCFFDFNNGFYRLCPKEFGGDFWDEFHDGVESAEALFANTLQKIKRFHKLA